MTKTFILDGPFMKGFILWMDSLEHWSLIPQLQLKRYTELLTFYCEPVLYSLGIANDNRKNWIEEKLQRVFTL